MTTANKNDKRDKKPAMQFVHPRLALGCGNAMGAGEIKYGGWNFLLGHGRMQLLAAIERHTAAIKVGELIDADTSELWGSTVYHSDCIAACLNMMYWQEEFGTLIEDRPIGVIEGVVTFARDKIILDEAINEILSPETLNANTIEIGDRVTVTADTNIWVGIVDSIDEDSDLLTYYVKGGLEYQHFWVARDQVTLRKKKGT